MRTTIQFGFGVAAWLVSGAALAQAQSAAPQPFRAGTPLSATNEAGQVMPMSSNVKVYGSFHFADSCTFDPDRNVIVAMNAANPPSRALRPMKNAVAIDTVLDPRLNEAVIVKKFPSAFFETDLQERLHALGVDTIVLAGCTTSVCVRATAVDAMQRNFHTLVAAEAVGDFDPGLYRDGGPDGIHPGRSGGCRIPMGRSGAAANRVRHGAGADREPRRA